MKLRWLLFLNPILCLYAYEQAMQTSMEIHSLLNKIGRLISTECIAGQAWLATGPRRLELHTATRLKLLERPTQGTI